MKSWESQRRVRIQPRHLGFVVGGPREMGILVMSLGRSDIVSLVGGLLFVEIRKWS